jgi:hypothetical protein
VQKQQQIVLATNFQKEFPQLLQEIDEKRESKQLYTDYTTLHDF